MRAIITLKTFPHEPEIPERRSVGEVCAGLTEPGARHIYNFGVALQFSCSCFLIVVDFTLVRTPTAVHSSRMDGLLMIFQFVLRAEGLIA